MLLPVGNMIKHLPDAANMMNYALKEGGASYGNLS